MRARDDLPTISLVDHASLDRIARAAMRRRRLPPTAKWLAQELERAQLVCPTELPPDVISMHSTVEFDDGMLDRVRRGTLVYPGEEDADVDRVPVLSPLGTALIGMAEGQSIRWQAPSGDRRVLRVLRVLYQPERSGHAAGGDASGRPGRPAFGVPASLARALPADFVLSRSGPDGRDTRSGSPEVARRVVDGSKEVRT